MKRLKCFVTPQNNESAGKKKTTRISRAGAYLKPLLVQIALAVSNSSKPPEIKDNTKLLKNAEAKKRLARRLLTVIWHILKKQEPYNAELYRKADKSPDNRVLTPEQVFALLRRNGYQIVEPDSVA